MSTSFHNRQTVCCYSCRWRSQSFWHSNSETIQVSRKPMRQQLWCSCASMSPRLHGRGVLSGGWCQVRFFHSRLARPAKVSRCPPTCCSPSSSRRRSSPSYVTSSMESSSSSRAGWSSWHFSSTSSCRRPRMCQLRRWFTCGANIGFGSASFQPKIPSTSILTDPPTAWRKASTSE